MIEFEMFSGTVEAGDHEKAEGQLQKLRTSTEQLEAQIQKRSTFI